jgi:membrane protein required for colicin V production
MVETSMNMFDLIVLAVVGLSALLSFFRGFIREVLSLGAWIGASVITLYYFEDVSRLIRPHVNSDVVASGLASIGTFIGALIGISLFTRLLGKYVKSGSDVGVLDNVLGITFGAARGMLLVAIGYFIMSVVITEENYPDWVKNAATRPYVAKVANWVATIAPSYFDEISPVKSSDGDARLDEKLDMERTKAEDADTSSDLLDSITGGDGSDPEGTRWQSLEELRKNMGVE